MMTITGRNAGMQILIVDDHPLLREGIASAIGRETDMVVVGEAENGREAVEAFRRLRPDITLMDLQMPEMNGVEAISAIHAEAPSARIIVLTTYVGDVQAQRALKAGASGCILKSALGNDLLSTIRAVHGGRRHVASEIAKDIALHAGAEMLSERELEVLGEVTTGKSNKELAATLAISEDTIKAHLKSIFAKLGVRDRTEAVMVAARRGVIAPWS